MLVAAAAASAERTAGRDILPDKPRDPSMAGRLSPRHRSCCLHARCLRACDASGALRETPAQLVLLPRSQSMLCHRTVSVRHPPQPARRCLSSYVAPHRDQASWSAHAIYRCGEVRAETR